MTVPRIPAEVRDEIVRLRGERFTFREIAAVTGVSQATVQRFCQDHFGDLAKRARAALMREVALARAEMATAPLFHPEEWR